MLNLLLSILAVAMASVLTYSLVTQIELQNAFQDLRENNRRLDAAADALTARLGRLPNIDNLLAPAPDTSFAWATLPASMKGINSTVDGVRFLYCPFGYTNAGESIPNMTSATIQIASGDSYGAFVSAGYVIKTGLSLDASVSEMRPIAILVAAARRGSRPPRCDSVKMVNGRPTVEGGLARVILDHRSGIVSYGTYESTGTKFFVDSNGLGNGLSLESPTSLDAALSHYVSYRPASMSIKVIGAVEVSSTTWARFIAASRDSELRLRISGLYGSEFPVPIITTDSSQPWHLPAETVIDNITFTNTRFIVGTGDRLHFSGSVTIGTYGSEVEIGYPAIDQNVIEVLDGGQLKITSPGVAVYGRSKRLLFNLGSVSLDGGSLGGVPVKILVELGRDSSFSMYNSYIHGGNGVIGILDQGARTITGSSQNGSSVLIGSGAGSSCWSSVADSVGFKWSDNGSTKRSGVKAEGLFTPPGEGASSTQIEQYYRELGERRRARFINSSNFYCSVWSG